MLCDCCPGDRFLARPHLVPLCKRLFFAIFFAIFLRPNEQICPDSAGPFIVSILLALLFSLLPTLPRPFPAHDREKSKDRALRRVSFTRPKSSYSSGTFRTRGYS